MRITAADRPVGNFDALSFNESDLHATQKGEIQVTPTIKEPDSS